MPTKRSRFSAFGKPRRRPRPIPMINQLAQKANPADALYASVAMIGQILENLQKLLSGPMAPPVSEFYRSYVTLASKNLSDLLQQLSNRLNTSHRLDPVATAAVELLDALSEFDEEAALSLASVLQEQEQSVEADALLQQMMSQTNVKMTLHDPLIELVNSQIHVAGVLEIKSGNATAEVEFTETLPFQTTDHQLRGIQ
jgi:hypothetical protein